MQDTRSRRVDRRWSDGIHDRAGPVLDRLTDLTMFPLNGEHLTSQRSRHPQRDVLHQLAAMFSGDPTIEF